MKTDLHTVWFFRDSKFQRFKFWIPTVQLIPNEAVWGAQKGFILRVERTFEIVN